LQAEISSCDLGGQVRLSASPVRNGIQQKPVEYLPINGHSRLSCEGLLRVDSVEKLGEQEFS
jgi:hypothetical protein